MRKDDAPLEEHLCQVLLAQLVAEAPQDNQANHIGRVLQTVQGRSRPLVKPTLTVATAKAAVPQFSPASLLGRGR